jgi:cytidylate kinase
MAQREGWTREQALARCTDEDRTRERFARYFFGDAPFQPASYHAVFNTGRVPLKDVVSCVAALIRDAWGAEAARGAPAGRVLTLARELGAGDASFGPTLAARLGLTVYDRELLEQEAVRLGVPEAELAKIDERPSGIFQRLRPGSLHRRYFEVLGQLMQELAAQDNVLLAGRGGSRFLRDHPRAFHVRLVAPMAVRLRRVMAHRWLRQEPARKLIEESDARRRRFFESSFGADWASPLEYHLTANSGLLGPLAVDLVALAAERHWGRASDAQPPPRPDP